MDTSDGFFELSKEEVAELAIQISESASGCRVHSNAGELFEIVNCTNPDEKRNISSYSVMFCQTIHVGERETCTIVDRISEKTLGYTFPITAFRDGDNFEGLWLRRFADVGFRFATTYTNISKFGALKSIESLRNRTLYLDEIFNDNISILVIGKTALERMNVDSYTLELILLKHGINIIQSRIDILLNPSSSPWSTRIKIAKPGPLVSSESAVFLSLLRSADRDQFGVSAFLHLYQAFEFCIDHIFDWGVRKVAAETVNTWEMKSRLSQITGESYRLSLLDTEWLSALHSRTSLNELADVCGDFLKALEIEFEADDSWHKLLYKCRNVIVHNQIKMMKVDNLSLQHLVASLRSASLDILFCFGEPTADKTN